MSYLVKGRYVMVSKQKESQVFYHYCDIAKGNDFIGKK